MSEKINFIEISKITKEKLETMALDIQAQSLFFQTEQERLLDEATQENPDNIENIKKEIQAKSVAKVEELKKQQNETVEQILQESIELFKNNVEETENTYIINLINDGKLTIPNDYLHRHKAVIHNLLNEAQKVEGDQEKHTQFLINAIRELTKANIEVIFNNESLESFKTLDIANTSLKKMPAVIQYLPMIVDAINLAIRLIESELSKKK